MSFLYNFCFIEWVSASYYCHSLIMFNENEPILIKKKLERLTHIILEKLLLLPIFERLGKYIMKVREFVAKVCKWYF